MNTHQAEVKPAKFGETLTNNVEGNPEPSLRIEEGVETRRRVCIHCEKDIPRRKRKNAIYCSNRCRDAFVSYRHKLKHNLINKPGVGSGGNQEGESNHQWKDGKTLFRKRAFSHYPHECNRCKRVNNLTVHHQDRNRLNNNLDNLEILCKRCHQALHCKRDLITGKYIKG